MKDLGYTANRGNSHKSLQLYVQSLGINTSHFKGRSHGTTSGQSNPKYTLEEILVLDTKIY